jgi:outer membrane protein insertion porin family
MFSGGQAWAADAFVIAVFPFDVSSSEPQDQLRISIQENLTSRLSEAGARGIPVREVNRLVQAGGRRLDMSSVRDLAGELGADFALFGSLTVVGSHWSLDVRLLDSMGIRQPQSIFTEGSSLNNMVSQYDRLVREIIALASGQEQVSRVDVLGTRRIESDAVMQIMTSKPGGVYSPEAVNNDLRAIWAMGYFDDVRIDVESGVAGRILTVNVVEKPSVRQVLIVGASEVSEDDLREQAGLRAFQVYRPEVIGEIEGKILSVYRNAGYYNAKIRTAVEDLEGGEKSITFNIEEGNKSFIKSIRFVGNAQVDEDDLKEQMATSEKGWFTWITSANVLEPEKLNQDTERLSDYYISLGYLDSRVGEPAVTMEGDDIIITINVEEGSRYSLSSLSLSGDMLISQQELVPALTLQPGDWFEREKLRADISYITTLYADQGFAFADVRPNMSLDRVNHSVSMDYTVTRGQKVYFERILITGNNRTRDKVIRREFSVAEGDLFSSTALRQGTMRLRALDYFEDVSIATPKGSAEDRMDLRIDVKEKRTGQIQLGVGYSTADSAMIMGSVGEMNLFGLGQQLTFSGSIGGKGNRYIISFTEPWFLDSPVSFGVDVYDWDREYNSYTRRTTGGRIRMGWPTPWDRVRLYTYYTYEISDLYDLQPYASSYYIRESAGQHSTSSLRAILRRDTRDNAFLTTQGSDVSLSVEYAPEELGGNVNFIRVIGDGSVYLPLWFGHVGVVHGRLGWMTGTGDDDNMPIFERFFMGGINTMRGFRYMSVGERDPATNDYMGGDYLALLNLEYRFPLLEKMGLMGVVFTDIGNVWGSSWEFTDLRQSVGLGIRWNSPLGPLRLEYGYIIDPMDGDGTGGWEFTVGSVF